MKNYKISRKNSEYHVNLKIANFRKINPYSFYIFMKFEYYSALFFSEVMKKWNNYFFYVFFSLKIHLQPF